MCVLFFFEKKFVETESERMLRALREMEVADEQPHAVQPVWLASIKTSLHELQLEQRELRQSVRVLQTDILRMEHRQLRYETELNARVDQKLRQFEQSLALRLAIPGLWAFFLFFSLPPPAGIWV
jgi:hypothetical protein